MGEWTGRNSVSEIGGTITSVCSVSQKEVRKEGLKEVLMQIMNETPNLPRDVNLFKKRREPENKKEIHTKNFSQTLQNERQEKNLKGN